VAQPLDFSHANIVGAPSFANSAKGGYHEPIGNGLCAVMSAASQPTLAANNATRMGHLQLKCCRRSIARSVSRHTGAIPPV
jgi:hypothetical protein